MGVFIIELHMAIEIHRDVYIFCKHWLYIGTRIIFSGINLLARWHKESTVETIFVGAYCLQGTVLRALGTILALNPYLQPWEVGSRFTPLTEGETRTRG